MKPCPMPKSFREPLFKPFVWKGGGIIGVLSDLHVPYHDEAALSAALDEFDRYARSEKTKITGILHLGDGIDCAEISAYQKLPGKPSYREETLLTHDLLKHVKSRFRRAEHLYKLGNHDWRVEKYLLKNAPALIGMEGSSLADHLKLRELGIRTIAQDAPMYFGRLTGLHGHEFGESRSSPLNPAKTLFDRTLSHAFCGHHHQTSSFTKQNVRRETFHCFTVGCLSVLSPEYRRINQYNHGAAIIHLIGPSGYLFRNFRIENGKVQ